MHETKLRHLATEPVAKMRRMCMPAGQFVKPDSWMLSKSMLRPVNNNPLVFI